MEDTKRTKDKATTFSSEHTGLVKPCEYWGLSSHKDMVKQQRLLNTALSDAIKTTRYDK